MADLPQPIRGFGVTFRTMFKRVVTEQYPEDRDKYPPKPRFHGRHQLNRWPDGLEKCVGCELCAWACPADAIFVEGADNTDEERYSPGERYAKTYEINMLRCIFCGYCEDACPTNAIVLESIEFPTGYTRESMIYKKDMLLESPPINVPATPQQTPPGKYDRAILPYPPIDSAE